MKKRIFNSFLFLLIGTFMLIGIGNVMAMSTATTQYFSGGRTEQKLLKEVSGVKVNSVIDKDHTFALGNNYSDVEIINKEQAGDLSTTEKDAWNNPGKECADVTNVPDSELKNYCSGSYSMIITYPSVKAATNNPNDDTANKAIYDKIANGNFAARYKKVGKWDGKDVDVKLSVIDYEISKEAMALSEYTGKTPYIVFYNQKVNPRVPSEAKRLGVEVGLINWIEIKYDFYESGTENRIDVKGYTTYWDVDFWQGIHMINNNDGLYTTSDSALKYASLADVREGKDQTKKYPYVYESERASYRGYMSTGSFTETFSGSSMNRIYTFAAPNSKATASVLTDASGGIWNSAELATPEKNYSSKTEAGMDNAPVKVGDHIKYEIKYTNTNQDAAAEITITDTLSKGLKYVDGTSMLGNAKINLETGYPKDNGDGTTTLVWKTSVPKDSVGVLTYDVEVLNSAKSLVSNNAKVSVKNGPEYELNPLKNPIPTKTYASDTPSGANGAMVEKNNLIKYNIEYTNVLNREVKVIITDVLSKGLSYEKGTSSTNIGEPKTIKFDKSNGTTTLIWERVVPANTTESLTYSAKVEGTTKIVQNNASMRYGENGPVIKLAELKNPLAGSPSIINIPDTGSTIAIIGVVAGLALIGGGGYLVYKRYKKA